MRTPDELKALVEEYLDELELWPELHGQAESMRYAFVGWAASGSGPCICLATGEAVGAEPEQVLPAAAALELVHNFSLVHDDLPALDDDDGAPRQAERLGRVRRGEGDARRRRAARGGVPARAVVPVVGRRARARGGDARDDRRPVPRHDGAGDATSRRAPAEDRPRSSTRRSCARSRRPTCRRPTQRPWRAFADELGMLFQVVDDILDGDGYVVTLGVDGARAARRRGGRARAARSPSTPTRCRRAARRPRRWPRANRRRASPRARAYAHPVKKRLDVLLVERGLAESRAQAQALVHGRARAAATTRPGSRSTRTPSSSVDSPPPYVSRARAQARERARRVRGRRHGLDCFDVGASTGGFTDVLLQRGAARVIALDVGYGQLHPRLRDDPRVACSSGRTRGT